VSVTIHVVGLLAYLSEGTADGEKDDEREGEDEGGGGGGSSTVSGEQCEPTVSAAGGPDVWGVEAAEELAQLYRAGTVVRIPGHFSRFPPYPEFGGKVDSGCGGSGEGLHTGHGVEKGVQEEGWSAGTSDSSNWIKRSSTYQELGEGIEGGESSAEGCQETISGQGSTGSTGPLGLSGSVAQGYVAMRVTAGNMSDRVSGGYWHDEVRRVLYQWLVALRACEQCEG